MSSHWPPGVEPFDNKLGGVLCVCVCVCVCVLLPRWISSGGSDHHAAAAAAAAACPSGVPPRIRLSTTDMPAPMSVGRSVGRSATVTPHSTRLGRRVMSRLVSWLGNDSRRHVTSFVLPGHVTVVTSLPGREHRRSEQFTVGYDSGFANLDHSNFQQAARLLLRAQPSALAGRTWVAFRYIGSAVASVSYLKTAR